MSLQTAKNSLNGENDDNLLNAVIELLPYQCFSQDSGDASMLKFSSKGIDWIFDVILYIRLFNQRGSYHLEFPPEKFVFYKRQFVSSFCHTIPLIKVKNLIQGNRNFLKDNKLEMAVSFQVTQCWIDNYIPRRTNPFKHKTDVTLVVDTAKFKCNKYVSWLYYCKRYYHRWLEVGEAEWTAAGRSGECFNGTGLVGLGKAKFCFCHGELNWILVA